MLNKNILMAQTLSKNMLESKNCAKAPQARRSPRISKPGVAAVSDLSESAEGAKITLHVKLPTQETIQVHIADDKGVKSTSAEADSRLKFIICNAVGLPNTKSLVLSHQGKNLMESPERCSLSRYHLSTVYVSLALPGGAMTDKDVIDEVLGEEETIKLEQQFMNFINNSEQTEAAEIWSNLSHQQQAQALKHCSQHQIADLLDHLNQESLCLTMSMHKDKVLASGKTLMDLLKNDDRKLVVETFLKFGRPHKGDCSSSQMIKKLDDSTYDGFRSFQNLSSKSSYVQMIENPHIKKGQITLADELSSVKFLDNDQFRVLEPTLVEQIHENNNVREWTMKQVSPDPSMNNEQKSIISSFGFIDAEAGYWCRESFTIQNRISRLFKGQDDHIYIFSRQISEKDGSNDVLLHVFKFTDTSIFDLERDIKYIENLEQTVEKDLESNIDAQILAKFNKEITDEFNEMQSKCSDEQKSKSILLLKQDMQDYYPRRFSEWIGHVTRHMDGNDISQAGTNSDGLMDRENFKKFQGKHHDIIKHFSGGYHAENRDDCDKYYDLYNQLTPGVDGISRKDCLVWFMQIWFPLQCRLMVQHNKVGADLQVYTISENSHLGRELLKEEQTKKKDSDKKYLDQAPNLIENDGKLMIVYSSPTIEHGPSLYFYDLETGKTFAKVSKAELFVDSFLNEQVTNIRYIVGEQIFVRSIDFEQLLSQTNSLDQEIQEVAEDDQNLEVTQCKIQRQGDSHDNWANRYGEHGRTFEVYVHVNKYEDKVNLQKSFQLHFKKRENSDHGHYNWCLCLQSYVKEDDAEIVFKATKNIEGAEFITTKKVEGKGSEDAKTIVISQAPATHFTDNMKNVWLVETQFSVEELKSQDTKHDMPFAHWAGEGRCPLSFEVKSKFVSPVIFENESSMVGMFVSKDNHLQYFSHKQGDRAAPKIKQIMHEKKLWNNMVVNYPFLYYTGLTPDCREIIVANLADSKRPQKIIRLPEGTQLQNFMRSGLDDRMYFHAFMPGSGLRTDFELVFASPFKHYENDDCHDDVTIRRICENRCNEYARDQAKDIQIDFVQDKYVQDNKLFWISQNGLDGNEKVYMHGRGEATEHSSKVILKYQRSKKNNILWLSKSPSNGLQLNGVINISNYGGDVKSTKMNDCSLSDERFLSIFVESREEGDKCVDYITLLDEDLNLYSYAVNEKTQSFEQIGDVRNLTSQLKIDANWFNFNNKEEVNFDKYRQDYKLYSSHTVGVVIQNYVVYQNIDNQALVMVDTSHQAFQKVTTIKDEATQVNVNTNIDNTDFRLMECQVGSTAGTSYFVVYPAPESRSIDIFGFARESHQAELISEDFILTNRQNVDTYRFFGDQAILKQDSLYWTVIDQNGQIQPMPLKLEEDTTMVYSKQTESGTMIIFDPKNDEKNCRVTKFNLRGELVFDNTLDNENMSERIIKMFKAATSNENINEIKLSNLFLGSAGSSSKDGLYRVAYTVNFQNKRVQHSESFTLRGAVKIPMKDQSDKTNQVDLTLLIFECNSEDQVEQLQKAILANFFAVCRESLCIFQPQKYSIQIMSLKELETVNEENLVEPEQSQLVTTGQDRSQNLIWVKYNKKSPERIIDVKNLLGDRSSLKLDSLQSTTKRFSKSSSKETYDENYLQVSLKDRVFLYDLSFEDPKECLTCFGTNLLTERQNFFDLGLSVTSWSAAGQEAPWRQVTSNHLRNTFLEFVQKINEKEINRKKSFVSLIKNYSMSDVQGLNFASAMLKKNEKIEATSFQSMEVTYQGYNFFSFFNDRTKLQSILEFIYEQLQIMQDSDQNIEPLIRRIYQVLAQPAVQFFEQNEQQKYTRYDTKEDLASHFTTTLERCISLDTQLRDLLLNFSEKSDDFDLQDFARDQQNMDQLCANYSQTLHQFLTNQIKETPFSKEISMLEWPLQALKTPITFRMSSQAISQQQVQGLVNDHFKDFKSFNPTPVKVKVLKKSQLLLNNRNYICNNDVYPSSKGSDFMNVLFQGGLDQKIDIIKTYAFLPWLMYLISTLALFIFILRPDDGMEVSETTENYIQYALSALTLILICYQAYTIIVNIGDCSCRAIKNFVLSAWNVLDIIQLGATAWITISNLPQLGENSLKNEQRVAAACILLVIWMRCFEWLSLFESTTFFVSYFFRTLSDIKYFMVLFMIILAIFASCMLMLQNNLPQYDQAALPVLSADILLNQYMVGLSESASASFDDHPQWYMCWAFFLVTTFVTQITMINMITAIMIRSYSSVMEKKKILALDNKLTMTNSYKNLITRFSSSNNVPQNDEFLFVVKPVVNVEILLKASEEGLEGDEDQTETELERGFRVLRREMFKRMDQLDQNQSKAKDIQRDSVEQLKDQIMKSITKINQKTREENKQMKEKNERQIDELKEKMHENQKQVIEEIRKISSDKASADKEE